MRTLPLGVQHLLFKWMVLVFDLVDHGERLLPLYDAIFHFVVYDDLRAPVCQLLCFLTTKNHGMASILFLHPLPLFPSQGVKVHKELDPYSHFIALVAILSSYHFDPWHCQQR